MAHQNCATTSTQAKAFVATANTSPSPTTDPKQSSRVALTSATSSSPEDPNGGANQTNDGTESNGGSDATHDDTDDIIIDNESAENTRDAGSRVNYSRGGGKRSTDVKDTNELGELFHNVVVYFTSALQKRTFLYILL